MGDQAEIFEALFQREITRFFTLLTPVLRDSERLDTGLTDCVVFAVGYARRHMLLQKGLRDDPEVVLPWFTVRARPFVERGTDYLAPLFERLMTAEQLATIDSRAVCEWAFRLVTSFITTGGVIDTTDETALRAFVADCCRSAWSPHLSTRWCDYFATVRRNATSSSASTLCRVGGMMSRSPVDPFHESSPEMSASLPLSTRSVASPGLSCSASDFPALSAMTVWRRCRW